MKVKVFRCSDNQLWYSKVQLPLILEVQECKSIEHYGEFSDICPQYTCLAFYKDEKGNLILKDDCINWDEILDIVESRKTKKNDEGKPDFTLIPQEALLELAKVFTHGKEKYGEYNYSGGTNYTRYIAASLRHTNQFLTGEDIDESGVHHLACIAANALMALDNILTNKGVDNRNKVYKIDK